jgi:lysozyme
MKLDKNGYKLICEFEGLSLTPYLCSAKVSTIGYGNTYYPDGKRVTLLDDEITKEYAFEIFKEVADRFAKRVNEMVKTDINQNQLNALTSFAYNVGTGNFASSTLLKKVNVNPNDLAIKSEFKRWTKSNKVVVQGLVNRRKKEALVYFQKTL